MKRKNFKKENIAMDDVRILGICECCENEITDEDKEYYVSEDGLVFCSVECCLEHYGVTKIEV
jgi:hypothetical protein